MFTAQFAKGNGGVYRYYRCSKKKGVCSQGYVQEKHLATQLKERLQTIALCDRYTDWILEEIGRWEQEESTESHSTEQKLAKEIKASEAHLETLVSAYLDGDIPKEMYLKRKDTLMRSTLALKEKKQDFVHGRNNWVEPLREWVKDTQQATFLSLSTNFKEIASFVQKIGTNHTVRDKTARFSVPVPSQYVAKVRKTGSFPNGFPFSSSPAPLAPENLALTSEEVSMCADILAFARTHFEERQ